MDFVCKNTIQNTYVIDILLEHLQNSEWECLIWEMVGIRIIHAKKQLIAMDLERLNPIAPIPQAPITWLNNIRVATLRWSRVEHIIIVMFSNQT